MLRAPKRAQCAEETIVEIDGIIYRFIDVGGIRSSERRKWEHFFEVMWHQMRQRLAYFLKGSLTAD